MRTERYVVMIMLFGLFTFSFAYALVDKTQNWLPLQQIAINSESDVSIDENRNGIVDNAEKLGGYNANDFLKINGGTLKGVLFLYYGVGKIVDLDNPSYYIDPSYKSNFKKLCLNGECISSWSDILPQNTNSLDEDAVRSIVEEQISLMENLLNVNSSYYAYNLIGINKEDLLNLINLKNYCINGICSLGIDAVSLNGHMIGSNISDIPIIDPSITYDNLKVGYASFSSYANDTFYVNGIKAKDVISTLDRVNESLTYAILDINDLKSSNTLLWDKIQAILSELDDKESIVLEGLTPYVKNEIEDYLKEKGFIQVSMCESNENNVLLLRRDSSGNLIVECKYFDDMVRDKIVEKLKNKKCYNGIMKGFNENADISCETYSNLLHRLKDNGVVVVKTSCSDGDVLVYDVNSNEFECVSKKEIIDKGINCGSDGVVVKTSDGYECYSYAGLSSRLISHGNLIEKLKMEGMASKDWVEYNFIRKPSCSDGEVLVYKDGKFECKEIAISKQVELTDNRIISPYRIEDEAVNTLQCPPGYVMTGVKIEFEDVVDEAKMDWGDLDVKKIPAIINLQIICKQLNVDVGLSTH